MDEEPSQNLREQSESHKDEPTRKRPRGKYVSKACSYCRKRKLKCSGVSPCDRCSLRGTLCSFSNSTSSPQRQLSEADGYSNSNALPAILPESHHHGSGGLEARVESLENGLQALLQLLPQVRDESSAESQNDDGGGFQGDTTFSAPVNAFNARLTSLRQQLGCSATSVSPANTHTLSTTSAVVLSPGGKSMSTVQLGSKSLPFPNAIEYAQYLDLFFADINACHPCVNEAEFKSRSQQISAKRNVDPCNTCVLALNYIIFACADILTQSSPSEENERLLPGWKWYLVADEIIGKRRISGRGDLSLIQFLIFETFYLIHADMPNAAYNTSGLACCLCIQHGLHQQRLWGTNCTPFSKHMRQRIFWTMYFVDRRTALSCGRPYGIRDSDVDVDEPEWVDDRALFPDNILPAANPDASTNIFLSCVSSFASFAGEIWDQLFCASIQNNPSLIEERIVVIDSRIKHWLDTVFPAMPLLPQQAPPTRRHLWQKSLVLTRMQHLRLLLRRNIMTSLSYTTVDGIVCGSVAIDIVNVLKPHSSEARTPSPIRFHMAFSLGGAIVILATLLCRDLSAINLQANRPAYVESYRQGMDMLRDIASHLIAARRIVADLKDITEVVDLLLEDGAVQNLDFASVVPPNVEDLFPYGARGDFETFVNAEGLDGDGDSFAGPLGNDELGFLASWHNDVLWS